MNFEYTQVDLGLCHLRRLLREYAEYYKPRACTHVDHRCAGRPSLRNQAVRRSDRDPASARGRSSWSISVARRCLSARMNFDNAQRHEAMVPGVGPGLPPYRLECQPISESSPPLG